MLESSLVQEVSVGKVQSSPLAWFCKPWIFWLKFCHLCNEAVETNFAKLGKIVARHPCATICVSLLIVSVFATGLLFMRSENRIEKLYIPQDTESIKNLKKAREYGFDRPTRRTDLILINKGGTGNVLTEECFEDALDLHKIITNIHGYTDVCLPALYEADGTSCTTIGPLGVFNYDKNQLGDLLAKLNDPRVKNSMPYLGRVLGDISRDSNGRILSAKALRLVYLLKGAELGEEVSSDIANWELKFLNRMRTFNLSSLNCGPLFYGAGRSLDDAIAETAGTDFLLISITFTVMIGFACFMLGKYRDPVAGHGLLAMAGVLCVNLGIGAAFGLAMYCNVPFISIVGILPFLIVGVGIDDMFIIVDELDRTNSDQPLPDRVSAVMKHVGPAIAMTTITDLVAFAVGTTSKFPSIMYFCMYAALAITFAFILLVTLFVAFMAYDCKRVSSHRKDILFCLKSYSFNLVHSVTDESPPLQTSNRLMELLGRFLMRPFCKCVIVVFSIGLLAAGVYGTTFISEEFDRRTLAKDGSDYVKFIDVFDVNFEDGIQVDLVLESGVNYSDPSVPAKIENIFEIVKSNHYYEDNIISWFHEFRKWSGNSAVIVPTVKTFLQINPRFRSDVVFSSDNKSIDASRFYGFIKQTKSSVGLRNAMVTLRDDLAEKSDLPVFASSFSFIFIEQFVSTLPETIRNLALAGAAILIIAAFFLINPVVVILVFLGFVALIFELLGLMYAWGVSLNSISMINLVMAIGFAVDYSAHVAHAFVFSRYTNPEDRVVDALRTVGASVLMGGVSTFLGMVVTAFASSEIFRIFFKMFFGIVVLGLLHGLCFLPVWLSILCRQDLRKDRGITNTNLHNNAHVTSEV